MSQHVIWGIWVQFPQIAPIPEYLWNRYSSTHRGQWHYSKVSFDVKQGAEDFGLLFRCPGTWFGVFRPSFPKLPQYPSTCETGIARPTEGNDTRVRSHLMWNKELKTLDYFSCVPAHDLGYSAPVSPNCWNTWVTVKQVITQSTEGPDTRARSHLMWNKELKTWDYFSCVLAQDLGYSGPVSQNCPDPWVPVKDSQV